MARNQHVRRRLFVDPRVQGAILRRLLIHWCCVVAMGFCALLLIQVFEHGVDKPLTTHLANMWNEYAIVFAVLLLAVPGLAYDSVKLSHRFAGPIYAVRKALDKLADGEPIGTLALREGDFWVEVADSINKISDRLNEQQQLVEAEESKVS